MALLGQFSLNLSMNMQDVTVQDRINRVVKELAKLASTQDKDKLAFSSDSTYEDLRKIFTDKLLGNKDLLSLPVISLLAPSFPMMPSASGMPILPGHHLPSSNPILPVQHVKPQEPLQVLQQQPPAMREWHDDSEDEEEEEPHYN